jgi:hypothetical protein
MTPAKHLAKFPHARPSTVAYLIKRDTVTEQLRREIAQSRPRPWWAFWRRR